MSTSTWRYFLRRSWDTELYSLVVVMLNPSTADELNDDPTIRRCIGFAKREGYGGLVVVNLYGFRATNPDELVRHGYPEGALNDEVLVRVLDLQAHANRPVLVAWGARAQPERVARFREVAEGIGTTLLSLGVTRAGAPRHPLYVRADTPLEPWPPTT